MRRRLGAGCSTVRRMSIPTYTGVRHRPRTAATASAAIGLSGDARRRPLVRSTDGRRRPSVSAIVQDLGGFRAFLDCSAVNYLTRPGRDGAGLRQARRPVRPQAADVLRASGCSCSARCCARWPWSMPVLIAARGLQGLGAGAVQPIGMTDHRRHLHAARTGQGAGVRRERVGHLLGHRPDVRRAVQPAAQLAVHLLGERPAVPAGRVMLRRFRSRSSAGRKVDYARARYSPTSTTLVVLGLLEGGQSWAWTAWQTPVIFGPPP